jgi:hypothetical protein
MLTDRAAQRALVGPLPTLSGRPRPGIPCYSGRKSGTAAPVGEGARPSAPAHRRRGLLFCLSKEAAATSQLRTRSLTLAIRPQQAPRHGPGDSSVSRIAAAAARRPTIVVPLSGFVRLSSERTIEAVRQDCSFAKKRSLPRVRTIGRISSRGPQGPRSMPDDLVAVSSSSSRPRIRNSTSAPRPDHGRPPTLCRQASRSRPTAVGPAIRSQRVSDKMRLVW